MKKIGILTFQNADNYGALLQSYALKKILIGMGCKTCILNYYCNAIERYYKILKLPKFSVKDILKKYVKFVLSPFLLYIRCKFKEFRKKYLTDTEPIYPNTIQNYIQQYDMFITGSDQVFNPRITDFDSNYFLSFSKDRNKNFSYAASFGLSLKDLSNKEKEFLKDNLANFNYLSVREKQGNEITETLLSCKSEVNLDPTLLLNKESWQKIAVLPKQNRYVLLYLMYKDKKIISFAKELANKKKCKLIFISYSLDIIDRVPATHITPTPQEWLGWFLNADYVVTNSFHGFAFSVNFNKKFFLGRILGNQRNSRLNNLLDLVGLHKRLYTNFTTTDNYDTPIDWQDVNKKLETERQKSLNYLQKITK